MKSLLRGVLRRFGYDIVRHVPMPENPFEVLPLVVDARVAAGKPVRVLQIGANDGLRNDPVRPLVLRHRLPALFVEPLPDLFERLRANYADQPDVSFERCAVGERSGIGTLYRVRPDPDLPEWLQGIASFDRSHLSSAKFGFPGLESRVESVQVPVSTIPELLEKHGIAACDLLQIDTEGLDTRIVHWALDAGLRPAIIHYEFAHTPPDRRARCKSRLADLGYAFIDVGRDTLAVRPD